MERHEKQIDRFLLDYLNKNLKKGYKLEDLRLTLIKQGYIKFDIDHAIEIIKEKSKKEQKDKVDRELREAERLREEQEMEVVEEPKKGFFGRLFGG